MPYFHAYVCDYHPYRSCFLIQNIHSKETYHVLYDYSTHIWVPINEKGSCELPFACGILKKLYDQYGNQFALPFALRFREEYGGTCILFRLQETFYVQKDITCDTLIDFFIHFLLIIVYVSRLLGGITPSLSRMSFLYTRTHPVVSDVGKLNCLVKPSADCDRKFVKFLNTYTSLSLIRYMKKIAPHLFKTKKKRNETCLLNPKQSFDDFTHTIICKHQKTPIKEIFQYIETQNYKNFQFSFLHQ